MIIESLNLFKETVLTFPMLSNITTHFPPLYQGVSDRQQLNIECSGCLCYNKAHGKNEECWIGKKGDRYQTPDKQ